MIVVEANCSPTEGHHEAKPCVGIEQSQWRHQDKKPKILDSHKRATGTANANPVAPCQP